MQKTVTILNYESRREFSTDNFQCSIVFSVIDSALIGTPREKESTHTVMVIMTDFLMDAWRLDGAIENVVTGEMVKIALQSFEEHVTNLLQKGLLTERNLPHLEMTTKNSPTSCPYKISNIAYPAKTSFTVDIDGWGSTSDEPAVHPNIGILLGRMDDALSKGDYSGVLHASASIFETMAKDVVGSSNVQHQSLGGFFDSYRKHSHLPQEILDYIQDIYKLRNTAPLAGHGSTQAPNIDRKTAITLAEMTKAFVTIEYKSHQK